MAACREPGYDGVGATQFGSQMREDDLLLFSERFIHGPDRNFGLMLIFTHILEETSARRHVWERPLGRFCLSLEYMHVSLVCIVSCRCASQIFDRAATAPVNRTVRLQEGLSKVQSVVSSFLLFDISSLGTQAPTR